MDCPRVNNATRWWLRFRLWHLLLVVSLVALACGWYKNRRDYRLAKSRFYDAIQGNDVDVVRTVLQRYPSLLRTTSDAVRLPGNLTVYTHGETPVAVAVLYESRATFDFLLTLDPDVTSRAGGGRMRTTPIIWAVCKDDIHYLDALLQKGADPSIRDEGGRNATDWAKHFKKQNFVDLLNKHWPQGAHQVVPGL